MPSCKPKNKIACASSTEHRGRVLRGSDRSAEHGLAQTAAGRRQYEKEYGRPSQAPPASQLRNIRRDPSRLILRQQLGR